MPRREGEVLRLGTATGRTPIRRRVGQGPGIRRRGSYTQSGLSATRSSKPEPKNRRGAPAATLLARRPAQRLERRDLLYRRPCRLHGLSGARGEGGGRDTT